MMQEKTWPGEEEKYIIEAMKAPTVHRENTVVVRAEL